ncbi:MAG: hypothetical protein V7637_5192 [Mycobacteriales bacterium]|jgi:hypothetical protein
MDRRRVATGIGLLAVLGALVAVGLVVVPGSDAATTRLVTAPQAPRPLPTGPLPATVTPTWSAPSLPPGGSAADTGTIIVVTGGTISGRDARAGTQLWAYQRDNATVCGWLVQDGAVIAAYRKPGHGCTDLIALNAGTGARRWYRNTDLGPDATLVSANGVVIARAGDRLLAVDTGTGLNRWAARRPSCGYGPVQLSSLGVLVLLNCPDRTLLVDHDAYADSERWATDVPGTDPTALSVGDPTALLSTIDGKRTLTTFDGQGKVLGRVVDARLAPAGAVPLSAVATDSTVVLWTGTAVVAVNTRTQAVAWSAPALGPPLLQGKSVLVTGPTGFTERAAGTGAVTRTIQAGGRRPDQYALLSRVGALVTTSSPSTLTVYG